jgi:hypothetical protein
VSDITCVTAAAARLADGPLGLFPLMRLYRAPHLPFTRGFFRRSPRICSCSICDRSRSASLASASDRSRKAALSRSSRSSRVSTSSLLGIPESNSRDGAALAGDAWLHALDRSSRPLLSPFEPPVGAAAAACHMRARQSTWQCNRTTPLRDRNLCGAHTVLTGYAPESADPGVRWHPLQSF